MYQPSAGNSAGGLVASVTVAASTTASTGTLPGNGYPKNIQISNTTTSWAYVNFGNSTSLAAATVATGYPVPPGAAYVVTISTEVNTVSVILSTGTGNVIFTRGEGV